MRTQLPTVKILHSAYPFVNDLCSYLTEICGETLKARCPSFQPQDSDPQSYCHLLHTTYVASGQKQDLRLEYEGPHVGMDGVVKRAQEILFQSNNSKSNILKAGYTKRKGASSIANITVNTIVTALLGPDWEILLQRTGIAVVLHLLVNTSVFVSLPNGCLCQMTGESFVVPPKALDIAVAEATKKLLKRRRLICSSENSEDVPASKRQKREIRTSFRGLREPCGIKPPSLISIIRARMFYARPNYIPKTNKIIVGFPLQHVFNLDDKDATRYRNPKDKLWALQASNGKEQALKVRHALRYIFPRQHGLSNPFQITSTSETFEYRVYADREDEISRAIMRGKNKSTPQRLKDILPLADKMLWRHSKCPYKMLFDKFCPSKVKMENNIHIDDTTILEWMSERSIQIQTQKLCDVTTTSISAGNVSTSSALNDSTPKPRFADFACSYAEVFRYVIIVIKAVIPKAFWGSKKNFKIITNYVRKFITGRRFETLTLHNVTQGFSTSDCDWLIPPGPGARKQHRVSVSDALKRRELLEEFLFWFFDSFVSPLIKTCFYVTESSAFRNHVLYFRQDDWATLCAPLLEKLTTTTFSQLPETDAAEILRQRELGFSFVRLLPKETGVRPIVNLRRKQNDGGTSINKLLQATFHLLNYEKKLQPSLTGASVRGSDEVYYRLLNFKSRLKRDQLKRLPKLYFVKVDVQACFDTIDQAKLLSIIKELISEDRYSIRKYAHIQLNRDRVRKTIATVAYPQDENPQFLDMAMELANALRHTIFIDQSATTVNRAHALHLLNTHITDNILKIGSTYYRQVVGIPQGSILSSLLCSFFYGDLERQFGPYTEAEDSTLLRMVDDYLLITTDLSKATSFLDMMNKGHPEYGCFITKEKTMTNFDYDHQIMNIVDPQTRHFYWCGYAIDMKNLSVSADYVRYHGKKLANTLTVNRGRKLGTTFGQKMLRLAEARSHLIYVDPELNKKRVIYLNIYQNLLLSAMKMHCYLREWGVDWHKHIGFIRKTVQKMVEHPFSFLRAQFRKKLSIPNRAGFIQKEAVLWLGYRAFYEIFSKKPARYRMLIKWLRSELDDSRRRNCERRFSVLVKDGLLGMGSIVY